MGKTHPCFQKCTLLTENDFYVKMWLAIFALDLMVGFIVKDKTY